MKKTAKHKASISFDFKLLCLLQINKVNSDISVNYSKKKLEMCFRQFFFPKNDKALLGISPINEVKAQVCPYLIL